jgi:hypothetical protein
MTSSARCHVRRSVTAAVTLAALLSGCSAGGASTAPPAAPRSSATAGAASPGAAQTPVPVESNPPGDIPDSIGFVGYRNASAGYGFRYPEGWARAESGSAVTFSDKLNGIAADTTGVPAQPTVDVVRQQVVPALQTSQPAFELRTVEAATIPAGHGVRLVYRRNSPPDPVTGRQVRQEVESYLVSNGRVQVRLDLSGPVGADNVDAYRTVATSLTLP